MTWVRYYSKKILGPYIGHMAADKAAKYMSVMRIAYFFSASTLLILFFKRSKEYEHRQLLMGRPIVENDLFSFGNSATTKAEAGIMYAYTPDEGWKLTEIHKDEQKQTMEQEAFRRAYNAQKKELEEGRPLPPGALVLVDEKDIKKKV